MVRPLPDWTVNSNKLCAIWKGCFDFDLADHFRDAFHDLVAGQNLSPLGHQVRNVLALARCLQYEVCDDCDTLGIVEFDASCQPSSCDRRRKRDHKLVLFSWREVHKLLLFMARFSMTTF